MYTFYAPDIADIMLVYRNGRHVASLKWDGETLHDLRGHVPEPAVEEVLANLDGLMANGHWKTSV